MRKYLLVTEKKWHLPLYEKLKERRNESWLLAENVKAFHKSTLDEIQPDIIFIPHWSHIIDEEIYSRFECVVFHMTDLPYGRGGSPLQNLIIRGHESTKLSAIKVCSEIDGGDVYLKKELSLCGTAEEIFIRATDVIFQMITEIIDMGIMPVPQQGEVTEFKRRKASDSDISGLTSVKAIYDHIRMLDADGYPKAFIDMGDFRFEFSRASLKAGDNIVADVRIFKK